MTLKNFPSYLSLYLIVIVLLLSTTNCLYPNQPYYKTRQIINYDIAFSSDSNVTLVVTSCGAVIHLRQTILSFFYYNTHPLSQMILVDRCSTPESDLMINLPQKANQNRQWFRVMTFSGTEMQAFQKAFQIVKTKYIMNIPNKWITYDGMGYIQQAIDAIQYGQRNGIKISQVTSLFPSWLNYRSLGTMRKTTSGTIFYQIRTFKPKERYYFTLNPSIINLQAVFGKIMNKNIENFCNKYQCSGFQDRDCCEKALGRELYQINQYIQVFVDDGSVKAKVFLVK